MTIIDIFDESERTKNLMIKGIKILISVKDRSLRKESATHTLRIKRATDGLNLKLKENGFSNIKVI